jgi:SSS family solute:Na+ symporter
MGMRTEIGEAALLIYIAAVIAIGIQAKAKTLEKFILGDALSTRAMVATVVSTFYGASAILGAVSLTYQMGLDALWFMVPFYLGNVAVVLLIKRITESERQTLPDFLGGFYGERFAVASSILLATLCLIPEEIIAGGKILSLFTPMPVEMAMGVIALVLIVPVAIGGMRADVKTDIAQFILMLLMLGMMLPLLLSQRLDLMMDVPAGTLTLGASMSTQDIAVFFVSLFFLPMTSAPLYQRLFASESEASSRKSLLYSIAIWIAIDSIVLLCGFAALRLFPNLKDPDMALILLGTALPVVGRVIFFLGLLAAIMSTVNSFLQSGASSLAYDAFRHVRPQAGPRRLLSLSRLFVVLLGLLSLVLALRFQMIVPALMFTLSMWTAGMLVPMLAALTGNKLREKTALHSLLGGAFASLVWRVWQPCDVDALFVGLGSSLLVAVASERLSGHSRLRE